MRTGKFVRIAIIALVAYSMYSNIAATRNNLSMGIQETPFDTIPQDSFNVSEVDNSGDPLREEELSNKLIHKITFVTQLSRDRLLMLKEIVNSWSGPISAVVVLKQDQFSDLDRFLSHFAHRSNIILTPYDSAQIEDRKQYPINILRNLAWTKSKTPFVFLVDVDFIPTKDTLQNLQDSFLVQRFIQEGGTLNQELVALVIPAFRGSTRNITIESKKDILSLLNIDLINPFGFQHHKATNYGYWITATEAYCVEPSTTDAYEPYVIVRYDAPKYDERFLGYGYNKVQHINQLTWIGYQFVVIPNAAIVHLPHIRSSEYMKEGDTQNKKLYEAFQKELWTKYGSPRIAHCSKLQNIIPFVPLEP